MQVALQYHARVFINGSSCTNNHDNQVSYTICIINAYSLNTSVKAINMKLVEALIRL